MTNQNSSLREASDNLREATANLAFETSRKLSIAGDRLAERHNYQNVNGIDAVKYHLMQKHNWLPSEVRGMSLDDLDFAIGEELNEQPSVYKTQGIRVL